MSFAESFVFFTAVQIFLIWIGWIVFRKIVFRKPVPAVPAASASYGPYTDALGHRYDKYGYRVFDDVPEEQGIPEHVVKGIIEDLRDRMIPSEIIPSK